MTVNSVDGNMNLIGAKTMDKKSNILSKDDFMRLLITQLKNQNPIEPMKNEDFIAQTAQFSSLEQLQNMNTLLTSLESSMNTSRNAIASSLIGRKVRTNGTIIQYNGKDIVPLRFNLNEDAVDVRVSIYGMNGELINTICSGSKPAGKNIIEWNGKGISGQNSPEGSYIYRVSALRENGEVMTDVYTTQGNVSSASFDKDNSYLNIEDKKVLLGDIIAIY